ncbi:winged helix-turn-helix transcriptional regulator [Azospirillum sp. SYSU D00513]|uniref:MarR family transcriptional regulator n=1 Tax=Azospirillum sp. SYSU D00513 TaxID=2812561 RepID=UPI001A95636D|nr:winged helix-turn-helix transcriptional regulator [Azospirillum sp. SYSU D00513]
MTLREQERALDIAADAGLPPDARPFAASDVAVPPPPTGLSEKERKIVACLSDGAAWRNARIEAETGIVFGLSGLLQKLAERGHVRKLRNGVWCSTDASEDVQVPLPYHRLPRQADLLFHLHAPLTAAELAERTSLPLGRVEWMLGRLQDKGYLRREGKCWTLKALPAQATLLRKNELLVLKTIPDHLVTDHGKIAEATGVNPFVLRKILLELGNRGLVELADFPRVTACRLTEEGRRHPVRDLPSPQAAMMTQRDAGAPAMMEALRILKARGAMQTRALSILLQGRLGSGSQTMGNHIQCMRKYGWIEPVDNNTDRPFYRCTDLGARLAAWLNEIALPVQTE